MSQTRDENVVETRVVGDVEYRLIVEQDEDPGCPWEEFDMLGTLVTWHRRMSIGHEQPEISADDWLACLVGVDEDSYYEWWRLRTPKSGVSFQDALNRKIDRELDAKGIVILPVYAYEHGGITISTGSFSCPWDSGQLGYIYTTKEKILESYGREKGTRLRPNDKNNARKVLEAEVKMSDQYLTGDVWCWRIESRVVPVLQSQTWSEADWQMLESCYGIYGYNDTVEDGRETLTMAIEIDVNCASSAQ